MPDEIRILLLADSHLGFDLPLRPRVERRRRGHDFLANYATALAPALAGEVDLVVHGGDVFDRSRVAPSVAYQAFEPLRRVADRGVPVFIVPGNHERSRLPHMRFASHPGVHIFDVARTFAVTVRGTTVAVAGFPYERDVRANFAEVLRRTGWDHVPAAVRLLCLHHCVEGATVGPVGYTFTTAADVIRHRDIPREFTAVCSGHIHRRQALTRDLNGRRLETPVLYPGSIERTSLAEIDETKGFLIVSVVPGDTSQTHWEFRDLPARPMIRRDIAVDRIDDTALAAAVGAIIAEAPTDAIVSLKLLGAPTDTQWRVVSSARLRAIAPPSMNVEIRAAGQPAGAPRFIIEADSPTGR